MPNPPLVQRTADDGPSASSYPSAGLIPLQLAVTNRALVRSPKGGTLSNMSRSRRRSPVFGVCADSDKADKRVARQRWRAVTRAAVNRGADVIPTLREVSDVWDMAKDGKIGRWHRPDPELMRK